MVTSQLKTNEWRGPRERSGSSGIYQDQVYSEIQFVQKGIPQGSLLGPLLFTLHKTNFGANIADAFIHFYADDTVMFCSHRAARTSAGCVY